MWSREIESTTYLAGNLDTSSIRRILLDPPDVTRVDHPKFDRTSRWTGVQEQYSAFRWRGIRDGRGGLGNGRFLSLDLQVFDIWGLFVVCVALR